MTLTAATTTATSFDLGSARALACRECGHEIPLAPEFACPQCFGPLEVAYDFPEVTRASIEAGPKSIWRYRQLLPVPSDVTRHPNTEPGLTRLIKADRLAAALGVRSLWVKDDTGNPTHSFKDRVVAVALAAAVDLGAGSRPAVGVRDDGKRCPPSPPRRRCTWCSATRSCWSSGPCGRWWTPRASPTRTSRSAACVPPRPPPQTWPPR